MAFTRKFLADNGVPEDKIDAIMAERNRTLNDYVLKADVQAQIDEAVNAARTTPEPVDVTKAPEYIALANKAAKLEAFQDEAFSAVKAPYRDIVWDRLDHGEEHKPYSEQITELSASMPDLFSAKTETPPTKPQFGADVKGGAPTGKAAPSFGSAWGFVPTK